MVKTRIASGELLYAKLKYLKRQYIPNTFAKRLRKTHKPAFLRQATHPPGFLSLLYGNPSQAILNNAVFPSLKLLLKKQCCYTINYLNL